MTVDRRYSSLKTIVPNVSRETTDRLIAFEELFRKWSSAINLASPSTLTDLWNRHILDSARYFHWHRRPRAGSIWDRVVVSLAL